MSDIHSDPAPATEQDAVQVAEPKVSTPSTPNASYQDGFRLVGKQSNKASASTTSSSSVTTNSSSSKSAPVLVRGLKKNPVTEPVTQVELVAWDAIRELVAQQKGKHHAVATTKAEVIAIKMQIGKNLHEQKALVGGKGREGKWGQLLEHIGCTRKVADTHNWRRRR